MLPEGGRLPDMQGVSNANLAWAEWESRQSAKSPSELSGLRGDPDGRKARGRWPASRVAWLTAVAAILFGATLALYLADELATPEQPSISRALAPAPSSARDDEIGELLREAAADIDALRLTTPAGENALERYQQVLTMEPDNEDASRGLEVIVIRYVTLANTALSNGDLEKAERYLDTAGAILPDDKGVALARNMLNVAKASESARDTATATSVPLADAVRDEPVSAGPRKVAVLPFWGRESAQAEQEGSDVGVVLSEFVHNFLRNRSSLELVYSYYQPGFDHDPVKRAGELWSGDAVSKVPRMGVLRDLGRTLGADAVLVYGYESRTGASAAVSIYLLDVEDGRTIRRDGDLAELAELTRESFEDLVGT